MLKKLDFSHHIKNLPDEVKKVFTIFQGKAFLVGGSVRNLLLDKEIADFDFASKLSPQQIIDVLKENKIKYVDLAMKYGTIVAVINKRNIEITSFRKDLTSDGRHPEVKFSDDMFEDAKRRDFTINALYLDLNGQLYDFFDGIDDLKQNIVKFIGEPDERIKEDYLRILRFFRFSCYYSKDFDQAGLASCIKLSDNIKKLSSERIRQELLKILAAPNHQSLITKINALWESGILRKIYLPSNDGKILGNLFLIADKFEQIKINSQLKLAAIFYNQKLQINTLSERLALTKKEKNYLSFFDNNYPKSLDIKDLTHLLASSKDLSELTDLVTFYLAQNYNQKNREHFTKFLVTIQILSSKSFPLSAADLIQSNIPKEKINSTIIKAKQLWIENDFKLKKLDLIKSCKSFYA